MKAVLFDLYETLITEAGKNITRASSLGPLLGCDDSEFRRQWRGTRSQIVLGELSFAEALIEISRKLGGNADRETIQSICDRRLEEKAAVFADVDEDVAHMVDALSSQGYRLAVVSNCFAEDVAAWSTWKLSKRFTGTAFSFEIGAAKPDAGIYTEAMRRLGVDEECSIFIGNGADDELVGAEGAGLRSFRASWFTGDDSQSANAPSKRECRRCAEVLNILSAA